METINSLPESSYEAVAESNGRVAIYPVMRSPVTRPIAIFPHGDDKNRAFRDAMMERANQMAAAPELFGALKMIADWLAESALVSGVTLEMLIRAETALRLAGDRDR